MTGQVLLERIRRRLTSAGLNVVLPLGRGGFDAVCIAGRGPSLHDLLARGEGAVIIGDGGPSFFSRFRAQHPAAANGEAGHDPLDTFTRAVMENAVADLFGPMVSRDSFRLLYPFTNAQPALPFQRLGQAAGLPAPGPLGIQIHPIHGPWWAYRALLIVSEVLIEEPPVAASCTNCPRPCVAACPGRAVLPLGFAVDRCMTHRPSDPGCWSSCIARTRCPVGSTHRYPDEQLAFHMAGSFGRAPSRSGTDA